jgi:DNA-damage-inducible protein J
MIKSDSILQVRIDTKTKAQASKVLDKMGLTMSEAVRLLLRRVAVEKALPFDVKVPNALTEETLLSSDKDENIVECIDKADFFRKTGIKDA